MPWARPTAQAEARVQPVPWVWRVSIRGPRSAVRRRRSSAGRRPVRRQRGRPSSAPPWRRASAEPRRRGADRRWCATARPVRAAASGALGVSSAASGSARRAGRSQRVGLEQRRAAVGAITGSTTSGTPAAPGIVGDRLDRRGRAEHAGLDRVGADVLQHRARLGGDDPAGDRMDGVDAQGVLHGDGGDGAMAASRRARSSS